MDCTFFGETLCKQTDATPQTWSLDPAVGNCDWPMFPELVQQPAPTIKLGASAWADLISETQDIFAFASHDAPLPNMLAEKKLHWTQRVALIRHNLHAASRTGDFTFFKTLQAHRLLEGTDHLAALNAAIGDAADQVLASLDNYNSVMAYVHEDAFKNVYESVKTGVREQTGSYDDRRAIYYVDAAQQKEKAEKAIDKMINSAITMINAQPPHSQEEAANVWIWGTTFVADAVEVCLAQIDAIECYLDDFIRLENSWAVVQSAVGASIGAIKGIFNLMAPCEAPEAQQHRSEATEGTVRSMLRRMSTAMTSGMNSAGPSRRQSVMSVTSLPPPPPIQHGSIQTGPAPSRGVGWRPSALKHTKGAFEPMATIPPTPAAAMLNTNPFDSSFSSGDQNFSVGDDVPPVPAHFHQAAAGPSASAQADNAGSPGSSAPGSNAGGGSGAAATATQNRPRSKNTTEKVPPFFDESMFLAQDDPLADDGDAHMADFGGLGLNSGMFRRLSTRFTPTAVH